MVSVIVPVYNRESTIKKCVESILAQSYRDLEVILVDDGSVDRSGEICDEYAKADNRVKVFHVNNSGVADARNFGIKQSSGDFISFVDSDDYIDKDYINKLYAAIDGDDCIMSFCNYIEVLNNISVPRILYSQNDCKSTKYIDDMLYCRVQGGLVCGKLYRHNLIHDLFEKYKYCEDLYFVFCYVTSNVGRVSIVPEPLYYYVRHENSITCAPKAVNLNDAISVAEKICDDCILRFHEHAKSAQAFVVNNSLFAYLQTAGEKSEDADILRKRVKNLVSKNRSKVVFDNNATIKTKGACLLSSFSYKLLTYIYGFIS